MPSSFTVSRSWDRAKLTRQFRLASPPACHLRCLAEDVTDPELSSVERLALVWPRVAHIREIRRELDYAKRRPDLSQF